MQNVLFEIEYVDDIRSTRLGPSHENYARPVVAALHSFHRGLAGFVVGSRQLGPFQLILADKLDA